MTKLLPDRASVENLKKQAKTLLHASRSDDAAALARVRPYYEENARFGMDQALLVIAREYGFSSWNTLRSHVETSEEKKVTHALNRLLGSAITEGANLIRLRCSKKSGSVRYDDDFQIEGYSVATMRGCLARVRQAAEAGEGGTTFQYRYRDNREALLMLVEDTPDSVLLALTPNSGSASIVSGDNREVPDAIYVESPREETVSKDAIAGWPKRLEGKRGYSGVAAGDDVVGIKFFNDDETPMAFVVDMLEKCFALSTKQATEAMLRIHSLGEAVVGLCARDGAEDLVESLNETSRAAGNPLRCEKATEEETRRYLEQHEQRE